MTISDHHDPRLPQWVRSRLRFVAKTKPNCGLGSTHMICHCLQKRLIAAEAELAELRQKAATAEGDSAV